jgi:hypothetical protein
MHDNEIEQLAKPARKPRVKKPPVEAMTAREKAIVLFTREHPDSHALDLIIAKSRSRKVITVRDPELGYKMEWTYDALSAPPAPKKAAPKKRAAPKGEVQPSL